MYSSSSSFNPFHYTTTTSFVDTHSIQEQQQQQQFFNFSPEPFLDNGDLHLSDFLTQHNHQQILGSNDISFAVETNQEDEMKLKASKKATTRSNKKKKSDSSKSKQAIPRKRIGKKDRHSKIYTAQGPRDRRMRLSLQIARKFFDLQDLLGFDKASNTIDWLFTKSKAAIKELTETVKISTNSDGSSRNVSSTSESEVISRSKLTTEDNSGGEKRGMETQSDSFNLVARKSRDKARARARERTKQKLNSKVLDESKHSSSPSNPNIFDQLGPSISLENGVKQEMKSAANMVGDQEAEDHESSTYFQLPHEMDSISIVEKFLGLTNSTKSSSIFNLSQNTVIPNGPDFEGHEYSGFPGNWDINNHKYYSMPNMKLSTTDNAHVQNPNAIFMATPNSQEENLISVFMATLDTQEQNPNSVFLNFEQNPSSIPMTTTATGFQSSFAEDHFSFNPINAANM